MENYDYLKRKVNKSTFYDTFIKKGNCYVDNDFGLGTTYKTMQILKDSAYKYQNQTKKLAKQLKGKNLPKTTTNIHRFLYNFHQYKADGFTQKMLSPQCAYASRFIGFDCKTFTLYGSTILLNLGINHYLTKIKQSTDDEEYSHVFIRIPINQTTNDLKQGYYIIDGTIETQNEVLKTNKKDTLMLAQMPHIGLNGVENPAQQIINNFNQLLAKLKQLGYSETTINSFKAAVKYYVDKGIDPKFYKAKNNNGIYVENIFVLFKKSGLNFPYGVIGNGGPVGIDLTYGGAGTISTLPPIDNIGGGSTGGGFNFSNLLGGLGNLQGGNTNEVIGNAAVMAADSVTGGLTSTIAGLIGFDIGDAINNILNGSWDCIGGSAWEKSDFIDKSNKFKSFFNPTFQKLLISQNFNEIGLLLTALDKFIHTHITYYTSIKNRGYNSCSTKILNKIINIGTPALDNFNKYVKEIKNIANVNETIIRNEPINWQQFNINQKLRGYKVTYTEYIVTPKPQNINSQNPTTGNQNPNSKKSNNLINIGLGIGIAKLTGLTKIIGL